MTAEDKAKEMLARWSQLIATPITGPCASTLIQVIAEEITRIDDRIDSANRYLRYRRRMGW